MVQDVRSSLRTFLASPAFAAAAVLTLALGLGGSTAVYTLLERVVLDPLPYPSAERLVRLNGQVPGAGTDAEWGLSAGQFFHFRESGRTLEEIGAYRAISTTVLTRAGAERTRLALVSAGALGLLGARAALGRGIDAGDDRPGAPLVVVLSHGFWERRFGGDPEAIGQPLDIFGQTAEIVGVMAPGVELPHEPGMLTTIQTDIWLPMRLNPEGPFYNDHALASIARLSPGVTVEQAQREVDRLTTRLTNVLPEIYPPAFFERYGFRTAVYPLKAYVIGEIAGNLWMLLVAVALVLLIACANVANLFLVRFEARRRELAIRTALGASRAALVRLFVAESLALTLPSAIAALAVCSWAIDSLISLAPPTVPRLGNLGIDGSVILFTFVAALFTAALLASFPILRHQRATSVGSLTDGGPSTTTGRDRQRVRSALIAGQVALALVLIVGAVLLGDSVRRLRATETGIQPEGVLTLELALPPARYKGHDEVWRVYKAALEGIRAVPGVAAAGASTTLPFTGGYGCTVQGFEDADVHARLQATSLTACASQKPTSPGFFEALGIPLRRGRTFTDADNDHPASGAVVVSEAFAKRFWPGQDPLGKGIGPNGRQEPPFYRVVGVVGDVYATGVDGEKAVAVYYPITRIPDTSGWSVPTSLRVVVKASGASPTALFGAVREAVRQVDPFIALGEAEEMQTLVDRSMSRVAFIMVLLSIAALLALSLAAIGLYGAISYLVARRTHEIGLRMALGAEPSQVQRQVIAGALPMVAAGLAAGTVASFALSRFLRGLLYGIEPTNPAAYAAAIVVLTAVAVIASWIPARRAARLQPTLALREP